MITCILRDKKYSIDFVSGRALRELEPAAQMTMAAIRDAIIPKTQMTTASFLIFPPMLLYIPFLPLFCGIDIPLGKAPAASAGPAGPAALPPFLYSTH